MKKTKIIIPALAMLLLGTAASVTGTVAWFSMNDTVTATGMKVTAKSDAAFLLISAGEKDAAGVQSDKLTTATAKNASAQLFPVANENITNSTTAETIVSGKYSNWYYMYSEDPNSATGKASTKANIAEADFAKYVLKNQFSISVAVGSNGVSNLKVKEATISTSGDQAVKVLVTTGDAFQEFSGTGDNTPADNTVLQASITSSTVCLVNVYIYWDGNDSDVYTNGIADLLETSVVLSFTGDIVPVE